LVVTPSTSTETVKILDHPCTLDLVLSRSRNAWRSEGSTKLKDLESGSAPILNSLAPVDVDKFKKAPVFAMAGKRAKIGAVVPGLGAPAGGSPAKAAVTAESGVRRGKRGSSRGCEFELQLSNLGLHLLQEYFSLVSHGSVCSDYTLSVNLEGLKNLIAVRQCLV
jgi:hypothetical protein